MEEETKKVEETVENLEDMKIEEQDIKDVTPPISEKKNNKKKKLFDKEKEEYQKANLELKEKVLRITAEMQNMRRRYDLDLANAYKYDGMDLVEKLLPVIDNFERAMNVKQDGVEKFLSGFKMIYDNLIEILKSKGVKEIDALNKPFDPNIMNAVVTEVNNEVPENTVLDVLQKGYMYNDKIVRHAMVKVSVKEENKED